MIPTSRTALIYLTGFLVCFGIANRNLSRTSEALSESVAQFHERMVARNITNSGAGEALYRLGQDINSRDGSAQSMFGGLSSTVLEDEDDDENDNKDNFSKSEIPNTKLNIPEP